MTLTELRAACERAGMDVRPFKHFREEWWYVTVGLFALHPEKKGHREWIEARCVSLLVTKVRECPALTARFHRALNVLTGCLAGTATDQQRIRAAMAVLSPAPPDGTGG